MVPALCIHGPERADCLPFAPTCLQYCHDVLGSWQGLTVNRAIVLIFCLAAAGAVAAYTHFSEQPSEQTPVFTVRVPPRAVEPAQPVSPPPQKFVVAPNDRVSLTRALQRELKRVGCYSGDINGVWTTSSRMAMKSFTDQVNASLPIDNPDHVLLSLVQGHAGSACDMAPVRSQADTAAADPMPEPPPEPSAVTTGSVVPSTAAAATALAATAAIAKAEPRARTSETHPAAASPDEPGAKSGRTDRSHREGSGLVPSERVYDRRPRRHSNNSKPPKFVRNILRAFGIR
jgi:hypothetical protein